MKLLTHTHLDAFAQKRFHTSHIFIPISGIPHYPSKTKHAILHFNQSSLLPNTKEKGRIQSGTSTSWNTQSVKNRKRQCRRNGFIPRVGGLHSVFRVKWNGNFRLEACAKKEGDTSKGVWERRFTCMWKREGIEFETCCTHIYLHFTTPFQLSFAHFVHWREHSWMHNAMGAFQKFQKFSIFAAEILWEVRKGWLDIRKFPSQNGKG